ncbi:hypothetical protein MYP_2604 [Sporocytophaga myxococcoides]|uniref:Uncharacterized protein n=1 Tax=Sporocytophaga myxococcoides TaxID=153721 RepID=A0A098LEN1_9BACT|nr:GAF domain-containing protein [Sporocytophaga myxococcoides]GAL85375.1 hypothetical protein MYP_2604 [Sporocytophaga myxococcoides]
MKNFPFILINKKFLDSLLKRNADNEFDIQSAAKFVKEIEQGNLDVLYEGEENTNQNVQNTLAFSLISMRDQMKRIAQQEKEIKWITEGLAMFVEILRSNHNLSELSDNIIRILVKYLGANQGALFIIHDEDPEDIHLRLASCYDYDRKKFFDQRINPGEGLSGQVLLEGASLYISEIPQDYIKITSGLGEARPTNILIVPLAVNNQVLGVVEIASFKKMLPYQIEFVEKLSESIASTIASVKVNEQTRNLLRETQMQAEHMRTQEEEMRQNMEELATTQEEMVRNQKLTEEILERERELSIEAEKNREMLSKLMMIAKSKNIQDGNLEGSLKEITIVLVDVLQINQASIWSYDERTGKIHLENLFMHSKMEYVSGQELSVNEFPIYLKLLEKGQSIVIDNTHETNAITDFHKRHAEFSITKSLLEVPFFINEKLAGIIRCENHLNVKKWKTLHLEFVKSVSDIIPIAYKTAESRTLLGESQIQAAHLKAQEEELRQSMEELASSQEEMRKSMIQLEAMKAELQVRENVFGLTTIMSESDQYGNILMANVKLCEVSKYSKEELIGKAHNIFRHPDMPKELFKLFWETIKAGKVFRGIIKNKAKDGSHYWVDATIVPVLDSNGLIIKYIGARYHITSDRIGVELYNSQARTLGLALINSDF